MPFKLIGRLAVLSSAAVALVMTAAVAADMTAEEAKLYEGAKGEGTITWYVSQYTTGEADALCALFTQRYAGVSCNAVRASGQVVFQRLQQELGANALQADVMSTNDAGQMFLLKKDNHLARFAPENLQYQVPELRELADSENYWITSGISPLVIGYNTNLVTEAEAPKNWTDLYDPKWSGQTAIGHPAFSGSVGLWTIAMRNLYGWEFFDKLNENKPQIGRSVADGHNLIVSGERKVALTPLPLVLQDSLLRNAPIKAVLPADGALLPPSAAAVMAKAPHPNAARLFVNFLLSEDAAQGDVKNLRYPLRSDVPPAEGVPPLDSYKKVMVPTEQGISDLQEVQSQFRDTFGI